MRSRSNRIVLVCLVLSLAAVAAGCQRPPSDALRNPAATATPPAATSAPVTSAPAETPAAVPSAAPVPPSSGQAATATGSVPLTFAVIGDYGTGDANAGRVAQLVGSWNPAFVVAVGDDYYGEAGGSGPARYDRSTGRFYGRWIADASTGTGEASSNAFFPALGNHDYSDAKPGPRTYLTYFTLPGRGFVNSSGNERYYEVIEGDVHLFVQNSKPREPDGARERSRQALWLRDALQKSPSRWNIVVFHHPPYSSDSEHGSQGWMRWPFAAWGADAVISGHAHTYERVMRDGIVYFVNGLGGDTRYAFGTPVQGSEVRFAKDWGAQRVSVTATAATFEFVDTRGEPVDTYVLRSKDASGN
jgi:tartrate-resistant acid phosphatase type 5